MNQESENKSKLQNEMDKVVNMDEASWSEYVKQISDKRKKEEQKDMSINVNELKTVSATTKTSTSKASNNSGLNTWWKKDDGLSVPFLPKGYEKDVKKYVREGAHNVWKDKKFEKILRMSQESLAEHCKSVLHNHGYVPVISNGWIYAKGTHPVLLVAHLDTVHDPKPTDFIYKDKYVTSPQGIGGDDRCGVKMILNIIKDIKCHVLFCFDEEKGCIGAGKFAKSKTCEELKESKSINYIIELDRRGTNDCVFYDCDNPDFTSFIQSTGYFKKDYGTCSDISDIAPALGVAAVNLSSGYFHEHHKDEYIDLEAMAIIEGEVRSIIGLECKEPYKYMESKYYAGYYGGYSGKGYYDDRWDDDRYEYGYSGQSQLSHYGYNDYSLGYADGWDEGYDEGFKKGAAITAEKYAKEKIEKNKETDFRIPCRKIEMTKLEAIKDADEYYSQYVILFTEDDKSKLAEVKATSSDEALGIFFQRFPDISASKITDFGII